MRATPSDRRIRTRSPVRPPSEDLAENLNRTVEKYLKVVAEKRRGDIHRRRKKGLILTILEYYLSLLELAAQLSQRATVYLKRQSEATDIYHRVKFAGWLPSPGDPLLGPSEDQDLESEFAESVRDLESETEEMRRNHRVFLQIIALQHQAREQCNLLFQFLLRLPFGL